MPLPITFWLAALAVVVGVSRCYLGVHYPCDVLVGCALAAAAAMAARPVLRLLGAAV